MTVPVIFSSGGMLLHGKKRGLDRDSVSAQTGHELLNHFLFMLFQKWTDHDPFDDTR